MEIKEFIEKMAEAIEIENADNLTAETKFRELGEWSSLSVMLLIAFFDEEMGKLIGDTEIKKYQTIGDLYNLATK
ncbi:MAG: acyl carrier protein [Prevotella sp.]|nr:acyl carrier protein [Bacteroidales bacterium]MBQ6653488.1 acyl carrier protein [Prevotella sp.]